MEALTKLAQAAAEGSARQIAEAVAAATGVSWLKFDESWESFGEGAGEAPGADAVQIVVGGQVIALQTTDDATAAIVRAGMERLCAQRGQMAAESRLNLNEKIAGLGSYDWNILEDVNDWSEQLYKIYGHEPGSFNASYEKFMELVHPEDRDRIRKVHEQAYGTGEPYEMEERIVRPDGSVRTLWSNGAVIRSADGTPVRMVGVCRDITELLEAEARDAERHDRMKRAEVLRQQALDVNDNIVQGLTAAVWAIDSDTPMVARSIAIETLDHARAMMHELLSAGDGPKSAGSLVRASASQVSIGVPPGTPVEPLAADGGCRVVLADDAEDLRSMLRVGLELAGGISVVGEAKDGVEAVALVADTIPDVVLLDLSMPNMDGLEACVQIKSTAPMTRVIILTGWGEETMGARAKEAGADAFLQKGASIAEIMAVVKDQYELATA